MKKFLIIWAFAVLMAVQAIAAPITAAQAQVVAEQFIARQSYIFRAPSSGGNQSLTMAYSSPDYNGVIDYYVFNRGNDDGFIVVSGDDCVLPVLGYADNGSFDYQSIPENMQWWLGEYQREIEYARLKGTAPRQMPVLDNSVLPLVKTTWDQAIVR